MGQHQATYRGGVQEWMVAMVNVLLDSLKKTRENNKIMFLDKKNRNKSSEMILC